MRVTTPKSKNAESFYISKGYVNDKGVSTSVIVRKLGTLNDLLKEHRPNPIIQMGLFMDGDGLPLAFSLFPGNSNEQTSLKPLENLASDPIRSYNHMGERAFIVTQSIKKLHQRLIVTYSPKYALYQKCIREKQVERAQKMIDSGNTKKQRKNPNDPARFIGTKAATKDGEAADIHHFLDEEKIESEAEYDGLYAVCTDLLDDDVSEILKVSEGRWLIEECFRIMKTDFSARPVYLRDENRIKAHFLICFLALLSYRLLGRKLNSRYTCEEILDTLKGMNFAGI